jgi:hypothetical protein
VAEAVDERAALRREVCSRLGQLGVPLQILAEDLCGEEDEAIDWVAVEPDGRVWVGVVDLEGGDASLLARGLAQRAWVRSRLADWLKLAPELAARPDLGARLLLVAPDFSRVTRIAAREADPAGIRLVRLRWGRGQREPDLALEPFDLEETPAGPGGSESTAVRRPAAPTSSVFRSGLSERDFEGDPGASSPRGGFG